MACQVSRNFVARRFHHVLCYSESTELSGWQQCLHHIEQDRGCLMHFCSVIFADMKLVTASMKSILMCAAM
eukprot:4108438-Amphidinium_carterae.1